MNDYAEQGQSTLESLTAIFDIREKKTLKDHCKNAVIYKSDFANLIMACMAEAIDIAYFSFFRHHHPQHLHLSNQDTTAIARNGVGPLNPEAKAAFNKVMETFRQRRLFNGHLFLPLLHPNDWHFFYFDQRDASPESSHWQHGSHMHLINMVTHPQLHVLDLVTKIEEDDRPQLGGGMHIRYQN
jgi:hypothetical protein